MNRPADASASISPAAAAAAVVARPGLVSHWDFQDPAGSPRVAQGPHAYALREGAGPVARVSPTAGGVFGPHAAELRAGDFLFIPRAECPALDLTAQLTVVAWVQRHRKPEVQCEAIAGMWDETRRQRHYALFLDLRIHQAGDNVAAHVSRTGGPTPGYPWCMDAAIGASYVDYFRWHCVAMTYDFQSARAYLDGTLDARPGFNPYAYPGGLHRAGPDGADFTVGAVHRGGEMGNGFVGRLGGLAIYDRALAPTELAELAALTPGFPTTPLTRPPVLV